MTAADVVVVTTAPGLGDEVQALKAGILEIADVLVVNKADREGADRAVRDLTTMLDLAAARARPRERRRRAGAEDRRVDRRAGIDALVQAIDAARLAAPESRLTRRRRQAEAQVLAIAGELPGRAGAASALRDAGPRRWSTTSRRAGAIPTAWRRSSSRRSRDGDKIGACVARLRSGLSPWPP